MAALSLRVSWNAYSSKWNFTGVPLNANQVRAHSVSRRSSCLVNRVKDNGSPRIAHDESWMAREIDTQPHDVTFR